MTMENTNLEGQEPLRDDNAVSCSLENSTEFGDDNHSNVNCSEAKSDFEMIIGKRPLVLDIKQPKFSRRCRQIQRTFPCSKEINFHNYIINSDKHLGQFCVESGSQDIFYGNGDLLNIPANATASGYVFKSSKHRKTTRSINNPSDFFVECSPGVQSGNIIISPSARWMYDSIEGSAKRMGLMEILLSFDPVKQDVSMEQIRTKLASTTEMKSSDLASFRRFDGHLSEDLKSPAKPLMRQGSEAKISQRLILSSSSTRSTSSYLSTSPARCFVTSALLYCVWESNLPYFLFVVGDDGGEVYVASPLKTRHSVDKSLDYIYLFHSWKPSIKESKRNVVNSSHVVGKMAVLSSLIVNTNRSKFMETEFVLFGVNEEKEKSLFNVKKSGGISKKVAEIFRPSHSSKHNPKNKVGESGSQFEDLQQFFPDELQTIVEPDHADHLANDFPPNLELAAIVVRDYGCNSSKGAAFGGWGLKFLEKVELNDADFSRELPSSSESCKERCRSDRQKTARNVTVLVPSGIHGGPVSRAGGPSSLTERWKSSGHCDCGGWDAGCPLKVLKNGSELEEDCKSFELFIEGGKHSETTLQVLNVSKDMYVVNFQSTLSALQSFSIGVAFIHSQTPDLYPEL